MALKSIAKSIRISEEVFEYIEASPGKGFNDKFENIILEAKRGEAERKNNLERLEQEIEDARKCLYKTIRQEEELQTFFRQFCHMQRTIFEMKESLERAMAEHEEKEN